MHGKTHGTVLGDEAEVAGDDARGLNGFKRGLRGKTTGMLSRLNDGRIDEGNGQLFEIVGERQQVAADIDGGVAMDAGPQRSVGGIFASHGVVADELDGEGVVVNEQIRGNVEVGFLVAGRRSRRICPGVG